MRIAILSDVHDHLSNLAAAIESVLDADVLLCCGDLCSPFVIDQLALFARDVHIVFGNNDADLFRITDKAGKKVNCHLHGEFFEAEFDGLRFAMNHFDYLARPIGRSGAYDVVCFGHNHEFEISQSGNCLLINPGAIMGARFPGGKWQEIAPTFVVYDTATRLPTSFAVDRFTKQVSQFEL